MKREMDNDRQWMMAQVVLLIGTLVFFILYMLKN
jgi:hypothetical protein